MILLVKCIDIPDIHLTMTAYKDNSYHICSSLTSGLTSILFLIVFLSIQ